MKRALIKIAVALGGFALGLVLAAWLPTMSMKRGDQPKPSSIVGDPAPIPLASPKAVGLDWRPGSIYFERNVGQASIGVDFVSRGRGYVVFLNASGAELRFQTPASHPYSALNMQLVNASPSSNGVGLRGSASQVTYAIGNDKRAWIHSDQVFSRVAYSAVYPGIDLEYYGTEGQLEFDFVVQPGGNPRQIALDFDGAKSLSLDASGNLVVETESGTLLQRAPVAYQKQPNGDKSPVASRFYLDGHQVRVAVSDYDTKSPLIIDPVVMFSSYLGGALGDKGVAVATAANGAIVVVGDTLSADLSGASAAPDPGGFEDIYVSRYSVDGSLQTTTYLGGSGVDHVKDVVIDEKGNILLGGWTQSIDFPTNSSAGAVLQDNFGGGVADGFLVKLKPSGMVDFATYFGGAGRDEIRGVARANGDEVFVAGVTDIGSVGLTNPELPFGGGDDGFIAKISSGGDAIVWSSYLGGAGGDEANAVAVDSVGKVTVVGSTASADFPITALAYQRNIGSVSATDAFIARFDASLKSDYITYFGGAEDDAAASVGITQAGEAIVVGTTYSSDFPQANQIPGSSYQALSDAFAARLTADGTTLVYSTLLGGVGDDVANDVAVDADGAAYVVGLSSSADFPVSADNWPSVPVAGNQHGFFATLSPDVVSIAAGGNVLAHATLWGGSLVDTINSVAINNDRQAFFVGQTSSTDIYTLNPAQQQFAGGTADAFVAGIDMTAYLHVSVSASAYPVVYGDSVTYTIKVVNDGPSDIDKAELVLNLPSLAWVTNLAPDYSCTSDPVNERYVCTLPAMAAQDVLTVDVTLLPAVQGSFGVSAAVASPESDLDTADNFASVTSDVVSPSNTGAIYREFAGHIGDDLIYTVVDSEFNLDAQQIDSVSIVVVNETTNDQATLMFFETEPNSSVFKGFVHTVFAKVAGDSSDLLLGMQANDVITLGYLDNPSGATNKNSFSVLGGKSAGLYPVGVVKAGDRHHIVVGDPDYQGNPIVPDTITVLATSPLGDVETLLLVETGRNSRHFEGSVVTQYATSAGTSEDGTLNIENGSNITYGYLDAVGSTGGPEQLSIDAAGQAGADGSLDVSSTQIQPGESVQITVVDPDGDDNLTVSVNNLTTGESGFVNLAETGAATAIFSGQLDTVVASGAGAPGDVSLNVQPGDVLELNYSDQLTSSGPTIVRKVIVQVLGSEGVSPSVMIAPQTMAGSDVLLTVVDEAANTSANSADTIVVSVANKNTQEHEDVILTETSALSGQFVGNLPTLDTPGPGTNNDGVMNVSTQDQVKITYVTNAAVQVVFSAVGDIVAGSGGGTDSEVNFSIHEDERLNDVLPTSLTGGGISYKITSNPVVGRIFLSDSSTGAFTYIPAADAGGEVAFAYGVSDAGGNHENHQVVVSIIAVDDPPTIMSGRNTGRPYGNPVAAGATFVGRLIASDVDSGHLTYRIVDQPTDLTIALDQNSGWFTLVSDTETVGERSISYVANDGAQDSPVASWKFNFVGPPAGVDAASQGVGENNRSGSSSGTGTLDLGFLSLSCFWLGWRRRTNDGKRGSNAGISY